MSSKGSLYLVATPMGNMQDITIRAIETLSECDLIISEDTRTTGRLLKKYGILTPMQPYYSPKEKTLSERYIRKILDGANIALVSENGTPCISDPGYLIVKRAFEEEVKVRPVPGPSALSAALSVCGLPLGEIFFAGFLPRKKGKRKSYLEAHLKGEYTFVFYESKYRLLDTLNFITEINPETRVAVMRELTKKFEEIIRGSAREVMERISSRPGIKGEFTVVCSL